MKPASCPLPPPILHPLPPATRHPPPVSAGVLSTIVELLVSVDLDVKDRSRSVMEQFSVFGNGLALSETANDDMELSEDR